MGYKQAGKPLRKRLPHTIWLIVLAWVLMIAAKAPWWKFIPLAMITAGGALNFLVVALNGWYMPVCREARVATRSNFYTLIDKNTRLAFLGDIIRLPPRKARIFISPGDLLLYPGMLLCLVWFFLNSSS